MPSKVPEGSDINPSAPFVCGLYGSMDKVEGVETVLETGVLGGHRIRFSTFLDCLNPIAEVVVKVGKSQGHSFSMPHGDA